MEKPHGEEGGLEGVQETPLLCCCYLVAKLRRVCNPMDCSPPGSSVHGVSQARILEWVTISFSTESSPPSDRTRVSCIAGRFFTTELPEKLWRGAKTPLAT